MYRFWSRSLVALALVVLTLLSTLSAPGSADAQSCEFTQGFKTLHDLIPDVVGNCVENVHYVQEGIFVRDGLQRTTNGLLVWRWYDNVVAFTDGYRTWILGPSEVESRLNTELLPWEQELQNAVQLVESKGYKVNRAWTYNPGASLRVLTAFQVPTADAHQQNAFFFTSSGQYLGTDTSDTSADIGVASQTSDTVTLNYVLYRPEDPMCCSTGGTGEVRFFYDGQKVTPLDPIPSSDPNAPLSRR